MPPRQPLVIGASPPASTPTGTITFYLFAPGVTPNGTDSNNVYSDTVTVNGNGTYTTAAGTNPGGFLPNATGTYQWVAVYSGDTNNNSADSAFGDESETVTAAPQITVVKTADQAAISAGQTAGFTVTITNNGTVTDTGVTLTDPLPADANADINWSIDTSGTGKGAGTNPNDFAITGTQGSQSLTLSSSFLSGGDSLAPGQSISVHITSPTNSSDGTATSFAGAVGVFGPATGYDVLYEGTGGHILHVTNVTVHGNIGVGGTGAVAFSGPGTIGGRLDFSAANTGQFSNSNGSNIGPASVNYSVAAVTSALNTVNSLGSSLAGLGNNLAISGTQTINESAGKLVTVNGVSYRIFNVTSYSENDGKVVTINGDGSGDPVVFDFGFNSNVILGGDVVLTGGLSDDQVIWNFTTSGKNFSLNNNASSYPLPAAFHGVILAPNDPISLVNANLDGRVFGGDSSDMQIVSGDTINAPTGPLVNTATVSANGVPPQQSTATVTITPLGPAVSHGAAATMGFWHNKNGQAVINSFNGRSSATQLGNWLASNFPNLFGSFAGQTNAQVVADFQTAFGNVGGVQGNTYAQTFSVALAVYATDPALGADSTAAHNGFTIKPGGTGSDSYNVGSNGAAFGVLNNTSLNVFQILQILNSNYNPTTGQFYGGSQSLTSAANNVTNGINQGGDISLMAETGGTSSTANATLLTALSNLNTGTLLVSFTDTVAGDDVADEQTRISDALTNLDSELGSLGVNLVLATPDQANNADITVTVSSTSDIGGAAQGVLGVTQIGGQITLISGWNWYLGSDPSAIGSEQYDFQTIATHELGHALNLGHSRDTNSVMYPYLGTGQVRRELTANDLTVIVSAPETAPEPLMAEVSRHSSTEPGMAASTPSLQQASTNPVVPLAASQSVAAGNGFSTLSSGTTLVNPFVYSVNANLDRQGFTSAAPVCGLTASNGFSAESSPFSGKSFYRFSDAGFGQGGLKNGAGITSSINGPTARNDAVGEDGDGEGYLLNPTPETIEIGNDGWQYLEGRPGVDAVFAGDALFGSASRFHCADLVAQEENTMGDEGSGIAKLAMVLALMTGATAPRNADAQMRRRNASEKFWSR